MILKSRCVKPTMITMLALSYLTTITADSSDLDVFNYHGTVGNDYGPKDWGKVTCSNLDTCMGYPDTVPNAQGWNIGTKNQCMSCPADGSGHCGSHHNSPIDLDRNLNVNKSSIFNPCIDGHYIRHFDSSCSFDDLREKNAFTIERYGLTIKQPMAPSQLYSGFYNIDCVKPGGGRRWGRMDYPKGWSNWWLLSHIDFHVPSEHTQNGKRYDAEVQLHHYYSVTPQECHDGVDNTVAAVSIFLEVYEDADDWDMLDMSICAWREAEEKNRQSCGLPSVSTPYPGCYFYNRKGTTTTTTTTTTASNSTYISIQPNNGTNTTSTQGIRQRRRAMQQDGSKPYKPAVSAFDLFYENHQKMDAMQVNESFEPKKIKVDEESLDRMEDFDWDSHMAQLLEEEENKKLRKNETDGAQNHRNLMNYANLDWYNYFPFTAVRTEYYFRYSGSQTVPPCYGKFEMNQARRYNTMAWRVMKDPIRVTQRQIDELHRLIKDRIAPSSSPRKACQPDTGAAPDPNGRPGKIWAARPLQDQSAPHWAVFCECQWHSHFEEDNKWCRNFQNDQHTKYFVHPYNFENNGF